MVLVCAVSALAQGRRGPDPSERFLEITVVNESTANPADAPVWIAADGLAWTPNGTAAIGPLGGNGDSGGWWFFVPRERAETIREFKFTLGSWESVEVDAEGRDIANRRMPALDWSTTTDDNPILRLTMTVQGFASERGTRWPAAERSSSVVGSLRIEDFTSERLKNTRKVRVWTPPGYDDPANAERRYPVLFMHDGQNLFDDATSFAGEWKVDETATALIEAGQIEPFIVVGIDNAGAARAFEYLPMSAGKRLPGQGGGADLYIAMIREELVPWLTERFRVDNARHSMGGSSFGGVVTLHAAMSKPGWLRGIIAESPSFWVGDGAFLDMCSEGHRWPSRVFMAMGDLEYGRGDDDRALVDGLTLVAAAMRSSGLEEPRLKVVVGEGDRHNEQAWAKRLPDALRLLYGPE